MDVQMPDGTLITGVPDNYTKDQVLAKYQASQAPKRSGSLLSDALSQFNQGALFGLGDEATALAAKTFYGVPYDEALKMQREYNRGFEEENPLSSLALNLAGGIATGLGAGKVASAVAPEAVGALESYARAKPIATTTGTGAISGGAYGFGGSEGGLSERLGGAATGIAIGAPVGGLAGVVGSKVSKKLEGIIDRIAEKEAIVQKQISEPPQLSKAEQKVSDKLRQDFPNEDDYQKALRSSFASKDKGLVESGGEATARLAEGANQFPSAGPETQQYFNDRISGSADRLKQKINRYVSPKTNYLDTLDEIISEGRQKAAPLYTQAYKANQNVQSDVIDRILKTPAGRDALKEAGRDIQNEMGRVAKPDPELTAIAREIAAREGTEPPKGGVASGLKLKAIDYIKRAFDNKYNIAKRAGDTGEMRRIQDLKSSLISEADRLDRTGLYAKARKEAGDYISNSDALDAGRNFMKDDIEVIQRNMASFGTTEKEAYRVGVGKAIRENIDKTVDGSNVTKLFGNKTNRNKLSAILGDKNFQQLYSYAQAEDNIFKLRNQISSNSRTNIRAIASQEFDDETGKVIQDVAQHGWKSVAVDKVIGTIKKVRTGMSDKTAGEVAKILYETDPKEKYKILQRLQQTSKYRNDLVKRSAAADELEAFYGISDAIRNARIVQGTVGGVASKEIPSITIRNTGGK